MPTPEFLNRELVDDTSLRKIRNDFNNNLPIRHVVMDNFLSEPLAKTLYENFPSIHAMDTHYKGLNEKKAEHSNFSHLHPSFTTLHDYLCSSAFIKWMNEVTGAELLQTIEDRLGYGLHQGADKSFLDIHIDYNVHPIRNLYRKYNLILFLNPGWLQDWGGNLELWDSEVKNCIQSISPVFNRCVIFECSDVSYHGYNRVRVPEGITRKSIYQYYFVPLEEGVAFHDTIFKPRPQESVVKKVSTYSKDFAKNTAKKLLLKIGWKRFLR